MITIKSLNKSFGSKRVLNDINLDFEKGKISGIVGENGAGKTTLFKCIAGLEDFDGSVNYSKGKVREVCGFLPTNPFFLSRITGLEYIRLLLNARNIKSSNLIEQNIFDLPLNQYAETYSTGMKKKLALTAILLQNNEIFILDEPFNGVDIQSNIVIRQVLEKLKGLNKIIILSSHIFSTLNETCDILHHLKSGEIINTAKPEDFNKIEQEMKREGIGDRIDKLNLK